MVKKKAPSAKQKAAQEKFKKNIQKVSSLMKSGKAKTRKAAWRMIK
jgi:hypothetical protein